MGSATVSQDTWTFWNLTRNQVQQEIQGFKTWFHDASNIQPKTAPFPAMRIIHHYVSWQANDPLVHYTIPDLTDLLSVLPQEQATPNNVNNNGRIQMDNRTQYSPMDYFVDPNSFLTVNKAYRPWGMNGTLTDDTQPNTAVNLLVKDPLLGRSDDWELTTNKYPNVGWLGKVHRGTPWQTVYFKSPATDVNGTWARWAPHNITNWDGFGTILVDTFRTDPTNDFRLADLFTTAFSDSSSKGKLSVNQTNLAAWSAVLSGVSVPTNILAVSNNAYTVFIPPAGIYVNDPTAPPANLPAVAQIVQGINLTRTSTNAAGQPIFPSSTFSRLGDILNTPQLSTNSPYLVGVDRSTINDAMYERIPQQILGLLRGGDQPRFVVYAFGQALRPADRSIMNNGPAFGVCTNYQVTAESAIRAVVRIDGSTDPAQASNPDPAHRYPPRAVVESYNVLGPYY
jgi:hypothetical protein